MTQIWTIILFDNMHDYVYEGKREKEEEEREEEEEKIVEEAEVLSWK